MDTIHRLALKLAVLLFIIAASSNVRAQDLTAKANELNEQYKQEKIYLHIDRPSYWASDDIWFKAYMKNNVQPNCNLYVELINEKGIVIYKKTCWVMDGLAYGDIHLADTLSSGMYQVRAYTNWMRNFDEQWFYRRDLVIWNLRDRAVAEKPENLKARKVDFQLMPEGGTFLAGVKNRIAFKAIDTHGKGIDVQGVVIDENGLKVASVNSRFKGMGSFVITPKAGIKYYAQVTCAGDVPLTVDLPKALVTGVAMKIDAINNDNFQIEINQQGQAGPGKYLLAAESEGTVCYRKEIALNYGKGVFNIAKDEFPTGIVRFTLFDDQDKPHCERLVFVNHHDQVSLTVTSEKTQYEPRENVLIDISALQQDQVPLLANLSVSVYPSSTVYDEESYPENILTRFLLSSELKGRIEEPAWYFRNDSLSTLTALDHLMLTHGYRYFEWKQLEAQKMPVIAYRPETGIQLKGTVLSDLFHHPVPNANVLMIPLNTQLGFQEQTTDSTGHFAFSNLFFTDTLHVALRLQKENGRRVSGIKIDETSSTSPKANILPLTYLYDKENPSRAVTYMRGLNSEFLNRKWHLSDTILLGDINVQSWRKKKYEGVVRPYVEPDHVIDLSKSDNIYAKITETLENNYPYFRTFRAEGVFLDGMPDYGGWIDNIPASWFDRVEFVKMAALPGRGFGPGIFFYTKRGYKFKNIEMAPGIASAKTIGYSVIRNYYAPVYDGSDEVKNDKSDFRSSLYWNPVLQTNMDGQARLSFYNSDQIGPVKVVIEGIAEDGKLCRGVFDYEIVPKGISAR